MDTRSLFKALSAAAAVAIARTVLTSAGKPGRARGRSAHSNDCGSTRTQGASERFEDFDAAFSVFYERDRDERVGVRGERAERYVIEARPHLDVAGDDGVIAVVGEAREDIVLEADDSLVFGDEDADEADVIVERGGERVRVASAEFGLTIRVPHGTRVRVRSESGDVDVARVASIEVVADCGDIAIRNVAGTIRARSEQGDIVVHAADGWAGETIDCESDQGEVTVELPGGTAFDIDAASEHGEVSAPRSTSGAYVRLFSEQGDVVVTVRG